MPSGIEHDAYVLLRLELGKLSTDLTSVVDGLVEIVHLDVKVHRHLRLPFHGRPDGACVVPLPLEGQIVAGVLGWRDASAGSVGIRKQLPAQQASVELS